MSLRPFYLQANIEGRKTELNGGPRAKDGHMNVCLLMRDKGAKKIAYKVNCYPLEDSKLCMEIKDSNGKVLTKTVTDY